MDARRGTTGPVCRRVSGKVAGTGASSKLGEAPHRADGPAERLALQEPAGRRRALHSSTSFNAACATLSAAVGIPSRRSLPLAFGIIFSRTGIGRNSRALRRSRIPARNPTPDSMERGTAPSTPAERAPLLPRTRLHATTRKAGSYTRLYTSSNRRPGSAIAHWCSFVCIPRTRCSASWRSGHGAPTFTGDLRRRHPRREHAGPLRHVTGFPDLRLLWVLRPTPAASVGDGPSRRPAGCWSGRGPPGWFPRSLSTVRRRRHPVMPLRYRHGYAADLSPWPPDRRHGTGRGVPRARRAGTHRCPARIRQVGAGGIRLRGVRPLVSHVHLLVLLAGPGSSDGVEPSRRCRGCCPPSPSSQGPGCPQLRRSAATGLRRCPFITARLRAPRGARGRPPTADWGRPR